MKNIYKIFRSVIFSMVIFMPLTVLAAPLIPCDGTLANPCNFDALVTTIQNVINFLILVIASPIAALMFMYAGFLYLTAGENEGQATEAKGVFLSVFMGYVILLGAWVLVSFVLDYLTTPEYNLLG